MTRLANAIFEDATTKAGEINAITIRLSEIQRLKQNTALKETPELEELEEAMKFMKRKVKSQAYDMSFETSNNILGPEPPIVSESDRVYEKQGGEPPLIRRNRDKGPFAPRSLAGTPRGKRNPFIQLFAEILLTICGKF